jgi:hypothetical protein
MNNENDSPGESTNPSKLTGSLPRRTLSITDRFNLVVMGPIFLVVAVAATLWGTINIVQQTHRRSDLRFGSIETVGKITRTQKQKTSDIIYYNFTVNGTTFTGNAELPGCLSHSFRRSNVIPVRYLPANPNVNHPVAWEWSVLYWPPENSNLVVVPEFSSELQWFLAPLIFGPIGLVVLIGGRRQAGGPAGGAPLTKP